MILARADGVRVLLAPSTLGASMPVTVIAGLVHSRSTIEPSPIHSTPGATPDSARSRSSGYSTSAAGPLCSPATATLPASSWRLAITRLSVISASGTRPPHMPECTAWVSVRTSTSARTRPRRLVVSAGSPMSQLPESAITITSARSSSWCFVEQRREGARADLLLALDEHRDVDRQVVAEDPDRAEVRDDAGLVVGRTAPVEPPVALGRLERRAVPLGRVVLGLHVVVRVEQHRRRTLGALLVRDHRGREAVAAGGDDVDLVEALGPEQLGHRLRAALHLACPRRVGAHGLDPHQVLQVLADPGQHGLDLRADRGGVVAHARQPNRRAGAPTKRS